MIPSLVSVILAIYDKMYPPEADTTSPSNITDTYVVDTEEGASTPPEGKDESDVYEMQVVSHQSVV